MSYAVVTRKLGPSYCAFRLALKASCWALNFDELWDQINPRGMHGVHEPLMRCESREDQAYHCNDAKYQKMWYRSLMICCSNLSTPCNPKAKQNFNFGVRQLMLSGTP